MNMDDIKLSNGRDVFDRHTISARKYNMIIGAVLLYGFIATLIVTKTIGPIAIGINPFALLIGYIVLVLIGSFIVNGSDNPLISFLGYNLIVLPIGVVLTSVLYSYDPGLIFRTVIVTACVTGIMMIISMIVPSFFLKLGRVLFLSLLLVFIVEVFAIIFGWHVFHVTDVIMAVIFCGYIGYDWVVAQRLEPTVDNAVDSACNLYVDIVNLFLRLLHIMDNDE